MESKPSRLDVKIKISSKLSESEKLILSDNYPELTLVFQDTNFESHALSHASRKCERRVMLNQMNVANVRPVGKKFELIDVGGRICQNISDGLRYVHVETPAIDAKDMTRIENDFSYLLSYKLNPIKSWVVDINKAIKNKLNYDKCKVIKGMGNNFWCFNKSQNCNATADKLIFLHSLYDITLQEMADIFEIKKAKIARATLLFDFDILREEKKEGLIKSQNCKWKKDGENIIFYFLSDHSKVYTHNLKNYLSKFTNNRAISTSGKTVVEWELTTNRIGVQFINFTVIPQLAATLNRTPHVLQSVKNKSKVNIFYYTPMYSSSGAYNRTFKKERITIDEGYFNQVYSEVLRADNGRFTVPSVVNILTTFNSQVIINGSDIVKKQELSSQENFKLAHALFVMAFVEKMDMQNVTATITNYIKNVRDFNANNLLFKYISNIFSEVPVFNKYFGVGKLNVYEGINDVKTFSMFLEDMVAIKQEYGAFKTEVDSEYLTSNAFDAEIEELQDDECNHSMESNLEVLGDGNCSFNSFEKLLNTKLNSPNMRAEIVREQSELGFDFSDQLEDKSFVSYDFLNLIAIKLCVNLCLHSKIFNSRILFKNGFDRTVHIAHKDSHFSPITATCKKQRVNAIVENNTFLNMNTSCENAMELEMNVLKYQTQKQKGGSIDIFKILNASAIFFVLFLSTFMNFIPNLILKFLLVKRIMNLNFFSLVNFSVIACVLVQYVINVMFLDVTSLLCFVFASYDIYVFKNQIKSSVNKISIVRKHFKSVLIILSSLTAYALSTQLDGHLRANIVPDGYFCYKYETYETERVCAYDSISALFSVLYYLYNITVPFMQNFIYVHQTYDYSVYMYYLRILLIVLTLSVLHKNYKKLSSKFLGGGENQSIVVKLIIIFCVMLSYYYYNKSFVYSYVPSRYYFCVTKVNFWEHKEICAYYPSTFSEYFNNNTMDINGEISNIVSVVKYFLSLISYLIISIIIFIIVLTGIKVDSFVRQGERKQEIRILDNFSKDFEDTTITSKEETTVVDERFESDSVVETESDSESVEEEETVEKTTEKNVELVQEMLDIDNVKEANSMILHFVRDFEAKDFKGFAAHVAEKTKDYNYEWERAIKCNKTCFRTENKHDITVCNIVCNKENCFEVLDEYLKNAKFVGKTFYCPGLGMGLFGYSEETVISNLEKYSENKFKLYVGKDF